MKHVRDFTWAMVVYAAIYGALSFVTGRLAIYECERNLPRTEHCILVISAEQTNDS